MFLCMEEIYHLLVHVIKVNDLFMCVFGVCIGIGTDLLHIANNDWKCDLRNVEKKNVEKVFR